MVEIISHKGQTLAYIVPNRFNTPGAEKVLNLLQTEPARRRSAAPGHKRSSLAASPMRSSPTSSATVALPSPKAMYWA